MSNTTPEEGGCELSFPHRHKPSGNTPGDKGYVSLPDDLVMRHRKKVAGVTAFGIPVESMDRESLLALVGQMLDNAEAQAKELSRRTDFLMSIVRR